MTRETKDVWTMTREERIEWMTEQDTIAAASRATAPAPMTQMSDAALAQAADSYRRVQLEGGDGYNPYAVELADRQRAAHPMTDHRDATWHLVNDDAINRALRGED